MTEEDQIPTQSQNQSSSDSLNDSGELSYMNSDNDLGKAPQNSFVQDEISIHQSMQRGHEGQWVVQKPSSPARIEVNSKLIDYTVELFKYNQERSGEVYQTLKSKLRSGLMGQDLNYLTAAYYLSQKYEHMDN